MTLRTATRQKAKIRLGLSAVSGGGKTYSALLIAYGICGDWTKIGIIDTENGSADLYSHLGAYNVLTLTAPYSPERYIEAVHDCEKAGMDVIIIDSITHEWDGSGGCLEIQEKLGGKYQDWAKVTPRHRAFVDSLLRSPAHIITTVRRKQDYEMTKDGNGKMKVEKAGLKEVTREGWEYEITVNLEMDVRHNANASKDRTGLFMGHPEFIPTIETGKKIAEWCNSGVAPIQEPQQTHTDAPQGTKSPEPVQTPDPVNTDQLDTYNAILEQMYVSGSGAGDCLILQGKKHKGKELKELSPKELSEHVAEVEANLEKLTNGKKETFEAYLQILKQYQLPF